MVEIHMGITQRMNKISKLAFAHVCDHDGEKGIARNIEGNAQSLKRISGTGEQRETGGYISVFGCSAPTMSAERWYS